MKYNFKKLCNRKDTDCLKWDMMEPIFGHDDLIPLWVADMDFPVAKPVTDALKKRVEHPFYGYTQAGSSVINAVVDRMQRKFNWRIDPEWIVFTPGVVPALHVAIRSITHPGDGVILQEPTYHPFFPAVTNSGCQTVNNGLKLINGRYVMDYNGLEEIFKPKTRALSNSGRVKTIIFCNPHNPVGRSWDREEIIRMGEIVIKNGGVVISDEIHCEILFKGQKHIPFATISKEFEQNCIVCMSPSKTFNLAGLEVSSIIIPNKKIRDNFTNTRAGIVPNPNLFGYTALEAAYRFGDEWLEQVLDYLQDNLNFLMDYIKENIPIIKVIKTEGTYLVWLDCRGLGMDNITLRTFMREEARVGLEDGFIFGESGSGFMRMNIACPVSILEEALKQIEDAVNEFNTQM
ncbi:MalY/PatB family protein [Methanobacterium sp. SMA-27]|uniref:MalY/PatB family protein n=1 Tax=Methanobacterium sp. SMA-27 TaxID=1495336 RepID=UPI00064F3F88|nr:MalY/PatB family protein [Methanobacterium sp. SMA-27]